MTAENPRMAGRRWSAIMWLSHLAVDDNHGDRIAHPFGGEHFLFSRDYEYRLVWDEERHLWRVDIRRHAAGG